MGSSRRQSWAVLALVLGLWACRTHPAPAALSGPSKAGAPGTAINRDPKGPANVADYVARLTSPARIAELRPEEVVEFLHLPNDAWVADIGCGPGLFAVPFARAVPAGVVFAVDVEPGQLDALCQVVDGAALDNVVPVLATSAGPHLPPGRFDVLFLADTYHHLSERVTYMRRLHAALRAGGRLVLFEYKPGDLPVGPPADHKLRAGEMERELEAAGWKLETEIASHKFHDFQVWIPR